ncbi:MarR family transcriptional regulator [Streptomyces sp. NPDC053728]|uniref:MarR family transcriptional regulator n=1 Tax=Streptomyces sp. NPDC053728 TaxID=3155534 RepID=UPI00343DF884
MAIQHLSSAPSAPASSRPYPKAHPGYGKRSVPDQRPRRADDFGLLPPRERSIAGFIDHLPEGAAMDVKGLARQLPLYGQQAVASALKALSVAGYLRRVRCLVGGEGGQVRWVFRTFWSRTARDNEWWASLVAGTAQREQPVVPAPAAPVVPRQRTPEPGAEPLASTDPVVPAAEGASTSGSVPGAGSPAFSVPAAEAPSPAFLALAHLGRHDARLGLSEADCQVLEPLAAEWLARGVDAAYLTQALTAGLPPDVGSPVGLVRRRLNDKMPPRLAAAAPAPPAPDGPVRRTMVECARCGAPGRPEALPDGLCRPCRQPGPEGPDTSVEPPADRDVRTYVAGLRDLLKAP